MDEMVMGPALSTFPSLCRSAPMDILIFLRWMVGWSCKVSWAMFSVFAVVSRPKYPESCIPPPFNTVDGNKQFALHFEGEVVRFRPLPAWAFNGS